MAPRETLPFPPDEYMALVLGGVPELSSYFSEGGIWSVNMLDEHQFLGADIRLLDIGCGCGRVARALALLEKPLASYQGFDRHRGMIDWCRREITSRFPKFKFSYFDIKSAYQLMDKQNGTISAEEFKFPFGEASFDSIILWSVFTHMPISEIYNYLSETRRLLSPDGRVLLTVFLNEGDEDELKNGGFDFYLSKYRFLKALEESNFCYKFIANHSAQNFYILRTLPTGCG